MARGLHMGSSRSVSQRTAKAGYFYVGAKYTYYRTIAEGEYDLKASTFTETTRVATNVGWQNTNKFYVYDLAYIDYPGSGSYDTIHILKPCYVYKGSWSATPTLYQGGSTISIMIAEQSTQIPVTYYIREYTP